MRPVSSLYVNKRLSLRQFIQTTLLSVFGAAVLSALGASTVHAMVIEDTQCILGQPNSPQGLNCTANDIQLSSPAVTVLDGCDYPGDTATLQVIVDVTNTAQERYDIGVWLSVDGDPNMDGSETGICSVLTIPLYEDPPANTIQVLDVAGEWVNRNANACGDVKNQPTPQPPPATNPDADIRNVDMGTVSLLCVDTDGDGQINVPVIIAWDNLANSSCNIATDALPGTASKCSSNTELNLPVPIPAQLIVNKQTIPADPLAFPFNLTGPDSGIGGGFDGDYDFNLANGGTFDTGSGVFTGGLPAGSYVLVENPTPGWQGVGTCSSDIDGLNTEPASLDLRPGETVTCDFVNTTTTGLLTIRKTTTGGSTGSFDFFVDDTGGSIGPAIIIDTSVMNPNDSAAIVVDISETYTVTEALDPAFVLTSAVCTDVNDTTVGTADLATGAISGITVAPSDVITCTFANAPAGSVNITKVSVGGDDTFGFNTTVPLPVQFPGGNFTVMTAAGTGSQGVPNVQPSAPTYDLTETIIPAGWRFDSAVCLDENDADVSSGAQPAQGVTFTHGVGQTTNCTVTNVKLATIVIEKLTNPGGNVTDLFGFSGNIGGLPLGFSLMDGGSQSIVNVPVDSDPNVTTPYSISEDDPSPGFELTDITCSSSRGDALSSGSAATRVASINIRAGETVTCTFTNTEQATITIEKEISGTNPNGLNAQFPFTSDYFSGTAILNPGVGAPDSTIAIPVTPGQAYSITETDPYIEGWSLISATCGTPDEAVNLSGGTISNILPEPGADITCRFINAPLGSATIVKNAIGGDGVFGFLGPLEPFNNGGAGFEIDTSVSSSADFTNQLLPSVEYNVLENVVPANWTLASVVCVDPTGNSIPNGAENPPINPALGALIQATSDETVTCTFTNEFDAKLTINKVTVPASDITTEFAFTGTGDINASNLVGGGSVSTMGPKGTFVAAETPTAGWALTDIVCAGVDAQKITIGNTPLFVDGDENVSLDLDPGDDATCTFTNTKLGSITITKATVGDTGAFTFQGTDSNDAGIITSPFNLTTAGAPGEETVTFNGLLPGQYQFSETVPAGWAIDGTSGDIVCSGQSATPGSNSVSIALADGEDVSCTFTNTADGKLVAVKSTVPGGDTQLFVFSADTSAGSTKVWDTSGTNLTSLADGDSDSQTGQPGIYQIFELVTLGYEITNITCTGETLSQIFIGEIDSPDFDEGDAYVTVALEAGEVVTCDFENTKQATIIVEKLTDPGGAPDAFSFTGDVAGSITDGQTLTTQRLSPGRYQSMESAADGWDLTSVTCDDDNSSGDTVTRIATFNAEAGETVKCTFTNTIRRGKIIVDKVTLPANSIQSFTFFTNYGSSSFSLTDTATPNDSGDLLPTSLYGTPYSVVEQAVDGWAQTSAVCTGDIGGAKTPDAIDLLPGETVNCTFTNTIDSGKIVVDKITSPSGSSQSFAFVTNYGGLGFSLTDTSVPNDSGDLLPTSEFGTPYSVVEQAVDGWTQTFVECNGNIGGAKTPGAIVLLPGETVTCNFTNTIQPGTIIVDKQTAPTGSPQLFDFTLTGTNTSLAFQLADATTAYNSGDLLPTSENGTYNVAESLPTGWSQDIAATTCDDGSPPSAVNLTAGETVTCTFRNVQAGVSTFTKVSIGGDETFTFTADDPIGNFSLTTINGISPVGSGVSLAAGSYTITEDILAGWQLTDMVCTESILENSVIDIPNRTITLNVEDGETINCTVTNTKLGSITVSKATIPAGDPTSFTFAGDVSGNIADGGTIVVSDLLPGVYTSTESAVTGWDLTGILCDDGTSNIPSTGDVQTLTATFNLDAGEDVICQFTNTLLPIINLAKTLNGPAVLEANGTYTVGYTITASNSGGPGTYDLVDTFSPGAGITLNTASAVYLAGTENSQNGVQAPYPNFVTGEGLDAGLNESWIVTANFTVDPALLDPATSKCDPGQPVINTGFYNAVSGSDTETDTTDNATCTGLEDPIINLAKTVNGPAVLQADGSYVVEYTITATNTGGPGTYDLVDTFSPGAGITLNTATAIYVAGTESTQTGITGAYPNFVTTEGLGQGLDESWRVVANFTVDPVLVDPQSSKCEPTAPVINTGFYNAVSGSLTDVNPADDATCTGLLDPIINLAKTVNGPATLEADGTYTVEYTITATNTGGPGVYDLIDTFSPGSGITLDTATATYVAGTEDSQSGTPGAYPNFVTGEGLGETKDESWTVTASFTVDPAMVDPVDSQCDSAAPVINTGFYNAVSGSSTDIDDTDNDACTGLPEPGINLAKTVNGPATLEADGTYTVEYTITATNTGGPGSYDLIDAFTPGAGITLNTADAVYQAGTEDSQTGTTGAYPNFVANEGLAEGLDESWIVTASFAVDLALVTAESADCDTTNAGAENTGFNNGVTGSSTDTDLTDNMACTELELSTITVMKAIDGGDALPADFILTLTAADGVNDAGVDYASGDSVLAQAGVPYTLSEAADQVADYFENGIVCLDDSNQADVGHPVTLAEGQSVTCTLTNTLNEIVGAEATAEVCRNNAPYVRYSVNTTEGNATATDITWIKDDGSDEVVETILGAAISGEILWPGASVVDGVAVAWPGWSCDANGENCTQVDDGLVPTMQIRFDINPTETVIVDYPPATSGCSPVAGGPPIEILPVPANNPVALLLLTLMLLTGGWYFRPATMHRRKF